MIICQETQCTGCFACVNECKLDCISMEENHYGELHPKIDDSKCIECGACQKVCPNNAEVSYRYPIICYAAWNTNHTKREKSASGGIGNALADFTINKKNGVFVGTQYNKDFIPVHTMAKKGDDISCYQGSKYIKSIVGNSTFRQIQSLLEKGTDVTYISTPCQIAGLLSFLKKKYDNLITVDLMCHGVSPTRYFKDELTRIMRNKKISHLTDVRFRDNENHNFRMTLWDNEKLLFNKSGRCEYYFAAFLYGISLRESCYSCKYAKPERISDITIGDFIGLGKDVSFNHPKENVSAVLLNTEKGKLFYEEMSKAYPTIKNEQRLYEERLAYPYSLREPTPRPKCREKFRQQVRIKGFSKAIRKTIGFKVLKSRFWEFLRQYAITRKLLKVIKIDKD